MSEARIEIPMTPPRAVSPNARVHWRERHQAVQMWRQAGKYAALEINYGWERFVARDGCIMDVEIAWEKGRRFLDPDNAIGSMKAARDGIADVLFGGEDRYIVQGKMIQTRGDGTTTVTLRAMEAGRNGAS